MPQVKPAVQAPIIHARDYPGLQHISGPISRVMAELAARVKKG